MKNFVIGIFGNTPCLRPIEHLKPFPAKLVGGKKIKKYLPFLVAPKRLYMLLCWLFCRSVCLISLCF